MPTPRTMLAIALVVSACGGGDVTQAQTATTTTPTTTTTTTATTTIAPVTTPPSDAAGVSLSETSLGRVLVGPDGLTLYGFTVDDPGVSNCYDSCAQVWPPLPGDTPIGDDLDPTLFTTTSRTDGTTQLVMGDWPLYYFAGDSAPGDTNGHLVEGVWFVVTEEGELVGVGSGTRGDDGGYDY